MRTFSENSIVTFDAENFDLFIKVINDICKDNCTIHDSELIFIKKDYYITADLSRLFNNNPVSISLELDKDSISRLKSLKSNFDIMVIDKGDSYHFCTNDSTVKLKKAKPKTKPSFKITKKHSKTLLEAMIDEGHYFQQLMKGKKYFDLHFNGNSKNITKISSKNVEYNIDLINNGDSESTLTCKTLNIIRSHELDIKILKHDKKDNAFFYMKSKHLYAPNFYITIVEKLSPDHSAAL